MWFKSVKMYSDFSCIINAFKISMMDYRILLILNIALFKSNIFYIALFINFKTHINEDNVYLLKIEIFCS